MQALRQAAKQALVEYDQHSPLAVVMEELRIALKQPDRQSLQAAGTHPAPCARHCEAKAYELEIRGLKSALKQQAEPVAYKAVSKITGAVQYYAALPSYIDPVSWDILPLFDPPQRKPLTEEQIEPIAIDVLGYAALCKEEMKLFTQSVRAVEAAHGIKENSHD